MAGSPDDPVRLSPFQRIVRLDATAFEPVYLTVSMEGVRGTSFTAGLFETFSGVGIPRPGGFIYSGEFLTTITAEKVTPGPILGAGTLLDDTGRTAPANKELFSATSPLPHVFASEGQDYAPSTTVQWTEQTGSDVSVPGLSGFKSGPAMLAGYAPAFSQPLDDYNPFYPIPSPVIRKSAGWRDTDPSVPFATFDTSPTGITYDGVSYTVIGAKLQQGPFPVYSSVTYLCQRV